MDHLVFLIQQRWESFQIGFCSLCGQLVQSCRIHSQSILTQCVSSWNQLREVRVYSWVTQPAKNFLEYMKKCLIAYPHAVYNRFLIFIFNEVTRTHIYFSGACFLFGCFFGIIIGVKLLAVVSLTHRMRAIIINDYNGLESVHYVEDVSIPKIVNQKQILVQVKASGIDYCDLKVCEGYGRVLRKYLNKYNPNTNGEFPIVLGRDCAGVVVAVGMEVTKVEQGDEVWLAVPIYHPGTLSEYVVVSEEFVSIKPSQLSFEGAGALPYSIMTAWDALVTQAGMTEHSAVGKRVLIHAGASSVGVVALQLAHAWGCHVTTTVSSRASPLVHMLGADDIITYDNSDFEKELLLREKFDVILNTLGMVLHDLCMNHCIPGGIVITTSLTQLTSDSYGCIFGLFYALYLRVKYVFHKAPWLRGGGLGTVCVSGAVLDRVVSLIEAGKLQAVVDKAYSAQDAEVAFAHVAKGEQIGRTVIRFRSRPLMSRSEAY